MAVMERIMFELQTVADKMKDAILRREAGAVDEKEQEEPTATIAPSSVAAAEARPWNLRTRRTACKAPIADGSGKCMKIAQKLNHSPSRTGNPKGRF
ncbi:hypothetical protein K1719_039372 [Acacia pycnantha]|nr:hypothetical protein K1719_039372 [Acacia pycnantha]